MALIIKDRVKEITTTTGTGDVSLGGASATFDTFQSVMSNGDTTFYAIVHTASGTDEWEVGVGTWNTGNTLTRTTVYAGSNGTSAVNFSSGNKDIFMTYPASKAAVAGEDVTFADVTATNITATGTVTLAGDPTSALQAATKEYVDTIAAAGIHYHTPVRVEAPSNLNATYDNGTSGVGATLTNSGTQAALVIDGVTLSTSDRVLVYNQTNAAHNGIYTVTNTGSASTNWVLTRATDADSYGASDPDALGEGDAYFVKEGDTGAGELYVMNTSGVITFGTTNITFTVIAETAVYSAGTGLTLTGTTFSTNQDISTSASPTFNNITVTGTVDGRDVATDGSKLDGIEAGATADQTAAEIKTAYESNSNTNAFTDAEQTKLSGIETGATGDQTASEILTAIKTVDGAASGLDADLLDGQQGSYYLNTGTTFSGDVSGTYNNIVVANDSHTHDGRYYTETEADSRFVNATGDTMSNTLVVNTIDSGNPSASTDNIRVSGYGILGNRGTFYVTNNGPVQIGVGGTHNNDPAMTFTSTTNTSHHTLYEGSNRVFTDGYHPNADKWTTARTLSLSGDASGSVSWDGSANATLSVTVADDSHAHSRLYEKSTVDYGASYLQWFDVSGTGGSNGNGNTPSNPTSDWYHHIIANHANSGGYYVDIAQSFHSDAVYHRRLENGSLRSWQRFFTDAYHPNADKWTTARTLTLSGDASGSVSWDGSANATLSVTVADDSHSHLWSNISGNTRQNYNLVFKPANSANYAGFQFYNTAGGSAGYFLIAGSGANNTTYQPDGITLVADAGWLSLVSRTTSNTGVRISTGATPVVRQTIDSSGNIDFTGASFQYNNNNIWHAGNDGSGSGLDADTLDGYHLSTTRNSANTVPVRDANGYLQLGWINTTSGATTSTINKIYASYDDYVRYVTPATFRSQVTDGYYLGASSKAADSNLLDGIDSSSFLRSDATDSFSGTITSSATGIGMYYYGASAWRVSSTDSAHQRADARDDATNYSRLHWYGVSDGGATNYFRHAWYDGSAYINIDANSSNINFTRTTGTANLQVHGNTVWHAGNDGSGSGLDADLWDGNQFSSYLNQAVLSTSSPSFAGLNINGNLNAVDNIYIAGNVYHEGDTDTYLEFGVNQIRLITGGSAEVTIDPTGVRLGDSGNAYVQPVSGNYGSFQIDGGAHGGWEGYSIGGLHVFMSNGADCGIYNDIDNEWMAYFTRNGATNLYHNGTSKFATTSTGISVTGTVAATSYTGDGSSLTGISAGATGGGSDEIFWENGQNVTSNYTITNGKNAMSAGPITVNSGVTVTVGSGETWTVV